MRRKISKILSALFCFVFICQQSGFAQMAAELNLAGHLSAFRPGLTQDKFRPPHLRYLSYDALKNNFKLFVDKGDAEDKRPLPAETKKLLNYFLIGVSLPNDTFWVNLRPDAPDNIIDSALARTDMGRVMLEADLELKKDTAGATSPQTPEGKLYWDKLYQKAGELFGSENVTIPTLTRPWIVPDEIIIRETKDSAYIYKATLKVMLEQDYLRDSAAYNFFDPRLKVLNEYSAQLVRELIIPKLNKTINSAKRYAGLRQVYYSLILAQWFKSRKGAVPALVNSRNLADLTAAEPYSPSTYFQAYQASFKNGEYNLKEPMQTISGQSIRTYFSGGMQLMSAEFDRVLSNPGSPVKGNKIILPAVSSPVISERVTEFNVSSAGYLLSVGSGPDLNAEKAAVEQRLKRFLGSDFTIGAIPEAFQRRVYGALFKFWAPIIEFTGIVQDDLRRINFSYWTTEQDIIEVEEEKIIIMDSVAGYNRSSKDILLNLISNSLKRDAYHEFGEVCFAKYGQAYRFGSSDQKEYCVDSLVYQILSNIDRAEAVEYQEKELVKHAKNITADQRDAAEKAAAEMIRKIKDKSSQSASPVQDLATSNAQRIFSEDFTDVLQDESIGGNAGRDKAAVNGVVANDGKIVAFGNPQDLMPDIQAAVEKREYAKFSVRVNMLPLLKKQAVEYELVLYEDQKYSSEAEAALQGAVDLANRFSASRVRLDNAVDFAGLFRLIEDVGKVTSSGKEYSPEQLIMIIERVRAGAAELKNVPRAQLTPLWGLRKAVQRLLISERRAMLPDGKKGQAGSSSPINSGRIDSLFKNESGKSYLNVRGVSRLLQEVLGEEDAQMVRPVIIGSAAHFSGEDTWVDLALVGDVDIVLEAKAGTDLRTWDTIRQRFFQNLKDIFEQDTEYVADLKDASGKDADEKWFYDFRITAYDSQSIKFTLPPTFVTDSAAYMLESALRPLTEHYSPYEKPLKRYLMALTYLGSYFGEKEAVVKLMGEYERIIHSSVSFSQRDTQLDALVKELQNKIQGDLRRRYEREISGNAQKEADLLRFSRRFVITPEVSSSPVEDDKRPGFLQHHIPRLSSAYYDMLSVAGGGPSRGMVISAHHEKIRYWHQIGTEDWMVTDPDGKERKMSDQEETRFKEHISRSAAFSSLSKEDASAVRAELKRIGYVFSSAGSLRETGAGERRFNLVKFTDKDGKQSFKELEIKRLSRLSAEERKLAAEALSGMAKRGAVHTISLLNYAAKLKDSAEKGRPYAGTDAFLLVDTSTGLWQAYAIIVFRDSSWERELNLWVKTPDPAEGPAVSLGAHQILAYAVKDAADLGRDVVVFHSLTDLAEGEGLAFGRNKRDALTRFLAAHSDKLKKELSAAAEKNVSGAREALFVAGSPVVAGKAGSEQDVAGKGGIDFRALPIVTQAAASLRISESSVQRLGRMDLSVEWETIERTIKSGNKPSTERIRGYLQASSMQGNAGRDMGKVVRCISEILRSEEETCVATDPGLRDILIVLDSGVSAEELKSIFSAQKL